MADKFENIINLVTATKKTRKIREDQESILREFFEKEIWKVITPPESKSKLMTAYYDENGNIAHKWK